MSKKFKKNNQFEFEVYHLSEEVSWKVKTSSVPSFIARGRIPRYTDLVLIKETKSAVICIKTAESISQFDIVLKSFSLPWW